MIMKMGTSILKGITTGLLITVLTLLVVLGATLSGFENTIISYIVDFGLLLSCLAAGYRSSRSSGRILPSGIASGGYALVGVLLLALYFPIEPLGAVKIISQGTGLGLLAGILGAGVLSSDPNYDPYVTGYYPKKHQSFYERKDKDIYEIARLGANDRNRVSIGYKNQEIPDSWDRRAYLSNPQAENARIYELTNYDKDRLEEDEAFAWWKVETERRLRGK